MNINTQTISLFNFKNVIIINNNTIFNYKVKYNKNIIIKYNNFNKFKNISI